MSDYSDKIPLLPVHLGIIDDDKNTILEAALAPWLVVDLPSRQNNQKWSIVVGIGLTGTFSAWDGSE